MRYLTFLEISQSHTALVVELAVGPSCVAIHTVELAGFLLPLSFPQYFSPCVEKMSSMTIFVV